MITLFLLKLWGGFITIILLYVDDIILAGNYLQEFDFIKQQLDLHFRIKDLGLLKFFLGLEVAHSQLGISLSQHHCCLNLLTKAGLLGCKPAQTRMDPSLSLHQDSSAIYPDPSS